MISSQTREINVLEVVRFALYLSFETYIIQYHEVSD